MARYTYPAETCNEWLANGDRYCDESEG